MANEINNSYDNTLSGLLGTNIPDGSIGVGW